MSHFQAVYYRAADGTEPVRDYLEALDAKRRAALKNQVERLNLLDEADPHLPHPYTSQVEGELRELRCHYGSELYRILYRRSERLMVLLHVFRKRSRKVPEADVRLARRRWRDFAARMEARPRRRPRAAGKDAP